MSEDLYVSDNGASDRLLSVLKGEVALSKYWEEEKGTPDLLLTTYEDFANVVGDILRLQAITLSGSPEEVRAAEVECMILKHSLPTLKRELKAPASLGDDVLRTWLIHSQYISANNRVMDYLTKNKHKNKNTVTVFEEYMRGAISVCEKFIDAYDEGHSINELLSRFDVAFSIIEDAIGIKNN